MSCCPHSVCGFPLLQSKARKTEHRRLQRGHRGTDSGDFGQQRLSEQVNERLAKLTCPVYRAVVPIDCFVQIHMRGRIRDRQRVQAVVGHPPLVLRAGPTDGLQIVLRKRLLVSTAVAATSSVWAGHHQQRPGCNYDAYALTRAPETADGGEREARDKTPADGLMAAGSAYTSRCPAIDLRVAGGARKGACRARSGAAVDTPTPQTLGYGLCFYPNSSTSGTII